MRWVFVRFPPLSVKISPFQINEKGGGAYEFRCSSLSGETSSVKHLKNANGRRKASMIWLVLGTTVAIIISFTTIIVYSIKKGHSIQSISFEFVKLKVQAKFTKKAKRKTGAANTDLSNES